MRRMIRVVRLWGIWSSTFLSWTKSHHPPLQTKLSHFRLSCSKLGHPLHFMSKLKKNKKARSHLHQASLVKQGFPDKIAIQIKMSANPQKRIWIKKTTFCKNNPFSYRKRNFKARIKLFSSIFNKERRNCRSSSIINSRRRSIPRPSLSSSSKTRTSISNSKYNQLLNKSPNQTNLNHNLRLQARLTCSSNTSNQNLNSTRPSLTQSRLAHPQPTQLTT